MKARTSSAIVMAALAALAWTLMPAQEAPPGAPPYEEIIVAGGGAVSGVVKTASAPPRRSDFIVTKDQGTCGDRVPQEAVIRAPDGALKNVVVALEGITRGKAIDRTTALKLDNHRCRFDPHVAAVAVGQRMEIVNSDPILHSTHAKVEGARTVFNVALPVQNQKVPKTIKRPGVMTIRCDAGHDWMLAYIHAFEHPYFAVSDEKGSFRIDQIPPGAYRLTAWHEELGTQTVDVTIAAGQEVKLTLESLRK